jgi:hypothetical protein
MSGAIGGQLRTLPFTGITALPFIIIGLALTILGFTLTQMSRLRKT